jgi:hypothetical protein
MASSMAAISARKSDEFRVLRQALGYCWSVAAAALPEAARPLMDKWLRSPDKDVAWVMRTNLGKARISALGRAGSQKAGRCAGEGSGQSHTGEGEENQKLQARSLRALSGGDRDLGLGRREHSVQLVAFDRLL